MILFFILLNYSVNFGTFIGVQQSSQPTYVDAAVKVRDKFTHSVTLNTRFGLFTPRFLHLPSGNGLVVDSASSYKNE